MSINSFLITLASGNQMPTLTIRPKRLPRGQFHDFYIQHEPTFPRFIQLMGIESPGLTASLAIADVVVQLQE
jgi:2-hydroxyglutarate dehydrogenase